MTTKEHYINQLKYKLEGLIGRSISSNADVVELDVCINTILEEEVSYSTLRRFFGFIPQTTPSNRTLNLLSSAIGYKNFSDFCLSEEKDQEWEIVAFFVKLGIQGRLSPENRAVLYQLKEQGHFYPHFTSFLQGLLMQRNMLLFESLVNDAGLYPAYYFYRLRIADVLGMTMRVLPQNQLDEIFELVQKSPNMQELSLYLFVDYSHFNGYYGKWIQNIDLTNVPNRDDQLFIVLIRNLIAFYNQQPMVDLPDIPISNEVKLHPILKGRYFGQRLLMEGGKTSLLKTIFQIAKKSAHKQAFFFELFPMLIILKQFEVIEKIEKLYYEELLTRVNWSFEHKKAFTFIAFSLCAINRGDLKAAEIMLSLIQKNSIENAYLEYVRLLRCIPAYHLSILQENTKEAEIQLHQYEYLSKQLHFSFFTEGFIKTYF
jgi:hypothetical protein